MKIILLAFICSVLSVSSIFAQADKDAQQKQTEAQRTEMKKLDAMVGQWKGSGWIEQGKGKETFTGTENIQRKLGGLALLVEGIFVDKQDVVIHETLAVLSYNSAAKDYDFNTFLISGRKGAYKLKAEGEGWIWGFTFPGGEIRYHIKLTSDTWHETGEISMDEGKTWRSFFEMTLKKAQ
ncbi:MAG: hypothetical protein ABWZ66_12365 [Pyrinomonadaceae bacterium]